MLITVLAGLVRWAGLEHGLPHSIEPDSEVADQVELWRGERKAERASLDSATYPHLLARATVLLFEAPPHPREAGTRDLPGHLELAGRNYRDTRRTSALLSLLIVPGTFLVARRFMGAGWALAAAALAGFSLLGVGFAQQARPHAAEAGFTAMALAAALRLRERGDTSSWCLAALAAGLAVGCLHSGLAALLPIAAAHLWMGERRRWLEPRALLVVLGLGLAVAGFYPFVLPSALPAALPGEPPGAFIRREGSTLWVANHNLEFDRFDGGGFRTVLRTLWWYEPALLVLLAVALAVAAARLPRRRAARGAGEAGVRDAGTRAAACVVLAHALPYLLVLGLYGETFERFVLPLIPALATAAAWGTSRLRPRPLGAGLAGAALLFTFVLGARLAWLRSRPDTLTEAAAWIAAHVGPDEPVFLSPIPNPIHGDSSLELPLLRSKAALAGPGGPRPSYYNVWSRYQARLADGAAAGTRHDLRWLVWSARRSGVPAGVSALEFLAAHPRSFFDASGPGWFVIEDHLSRPENLTEILLQRALAEHGERVARFSPDAPERDRGFPFGGQDRDEDGGDWPHVAGRVLTARTTGPAVEVWRVDAAGLGER